MTGVRLNEGTAIWWEDVDFENKTLRIHHSLVIKNKSNWTRNAYTKTNSGMRILSLDDDTIAVLKIWKERQSKIGIHDFVFSYDGLSLIKSTISRIIKRYAKLAGVKPIQAKGLRHSNVSFLINELNASVLLISKRLGHSSPEITLKHYAHLWHNIDREIADAMSNTIKFNLPSESKVNFNGNQHIKQLE